MNCPKCSGNARKNGTDNNKGKISQKWYCKNCSYYFATAKDANEPFQLKAEPPTDKSLISEEDLRKKYDLFFIVNNYLKEIPAGRFIDETSLLKQLGFLGKPGSRNVLTREELKKFRGKVDGMIYYGAPCSITKLKQEGVLQ